MNLEITQKHIDRWKENTQKTARRLDYDPAILDFIDNNLKTRIVRDTIPPGIWFGFAWYDPKEPLIEIYDKNLSCKLDAEVIAEFKSIGVQDKTLAKVNIMLKIIPRRILFDVYNQSGMDHEMIGHIYNYLAKQPHNEKAAVEVQLKFAKARSGWIFHKIPWKIVSLLAPIILYHHKKDEF